MIFIFVLIELSSWISRATNNRLLMFQINVDKYLSKYFLSVAFVVVYVEILTKLTNFNVSHYN